MAKQAGELPIIQKTYDMILWFTNHVLKFPRAHRYTIGERLLQNWYGFLEELIEAKYRRGEAKTTVLDRANLRLEKMRYQVRLAKDMKCLPVKSYEHASKRMLEIGRELGGWARQSSERKESRKGG